MARLHDFMSLLCQPQTSLLSLVSINHPPADCTNPHPMILTNPPAVLVCSQVPVRDDRFLAAQALRLIGYLLATKSGRPCPALWDPDEPLKWMYGRYDRVMCV